MVMHEGFPIFRANKVSGVAIIFIIIKSIYLIFFFFFPSIHLPVWLPPYELLSLNDHFPSSVAANVNHPPEIHIQKLQCKTKTFG